MLVWIGKAAAVVGLVCGLVALFKKSLYSPGQPAVSYWNIDKSFAVFLLVLLVGSGLGLTAAYVAEDARFDRLAAVLGGVATGLYAFYPIYFTTVFWHFLGAGVWL